jgi:hypothetical protein
LAGADKILDKCACMSSSMSVFKAGGSAMFVFVLGTADYEDFRSFE